MEINQYDIFWVNLDPVIGHEMKKTRPCIILSPDEMNQYLQTIIIAPLTSTLRSYPTRIKVMLNNKASMIALDQIKTIDRRRLGKKEGSITKATILQVKNVLEEILIK